MSIKTSVCITIYLQIYVVLLLKLLSQVIDILRLTSNHIICENKNNSVPFSQKGPRVSKNIYFKNVYTSYLVSPSILPQSRDTWHLTPDTNNVPLNWCQTDTRSYNINLFHTRRMFRVNIVICYEARNSTPVFIMLNS